ncbi:hypothetical protein FGO68_gene2580 [Halteria grandinella]|uniref:Uncharacterized protein n=1 Tax=Halteria grandinella TaxID=5974 RepID=A0A8J8NZ26_HALGN|nr:hypothetical protein FGO68_gene2580 [Halteria grandinella]
MAIQKNCNYSALSVEKLQLTRLNVCSFKSIFNHILSDILKKCKATLRYLECNGSIDLTPLMNSGELRELELFEDTSDANLQLLRTFQNLEALYIDNIRVTEISDLSQKLMTQEFSRLDDKNIIALPQSVTTVKILSQQKLSSLKLFLDKNPCVKYVTIDLEYTFEAALLIDKYRHIQFNFDFKNTKDSSLFTSVYGCLHPEYKQRGISSSDPDHILYELLFQSLSVKFEFLMPYVDNQFQCKILLRDSPPQFIDSLSTFEEAKGSIEKINNRKISQIEGYYDKVFQKQITQNDDDEYLSIILTAYDIAFQLGGNIDQALVGIKAMPKEQRKNLKREEYFNKCKNNWQLSVTHQL